MGIGEIRICNIRKGDDRRGSLRSGISLKYVNSCGYEDNNSRCENRFYERKTVKYGI